MAPHVSGMSAATASTSPITAMSTLRPAESGRTSVASTPSVSSSSVMCTPKSAHPNRRVSAGIQPARSSIRVRSQDETDAGTVTAPIGALILNSGCRGPVGATMGG